MSLPGASRRDGGHPARHDGRRTASADPTGECLNWRSAPVNGDWEPLHAVTGGLSPWGSAVTRLHQFQGEHPDVQFTSPVMGRYEQYTALVPPGAIPGESREITVTSPDLCGLMDELDGLITNGKFCCVRRLELSLSWWHRPLRLRGSSLQGDVVLAGEPDEPDLERVPSAEHERRRRAPVGSGLSAAGALGRARRPAGSDADRGGGA